MAQVILKHVSKIYGEDVTAVDDINLDIAEGEFTVLVGPSGCGKSTTLRMIAGLETITKGEIFIDGKFVNNLPPKDRDIAMVFQNYALYPHMTVYDNISFGLRINKTPKDEIKKLVGEAAEILGLTEYLHRRPQALSGGEKQRVAVGRAIVRKPKVFLFDEPLSNLDAKLRTQMRAEIIKLHKKLGATMIYVTHDQTEAMTMGDRIIIMEDGIVQQIDEPMNIYNCPANIFVAGFIGNPAMNFINGKVKQNRTSMFLSLDGNISIELPEPKAKLIKRESTNITLGIRPENIKIEANSDLASIEGKFEFSESLGFETLIHFLIGEQKFVARESGRFNRLKYGDKISVNINPQSIDVFETDNGKRMK